MNVLKQIGSEFHITHRVPFKREYDLSPFFTICFEFAYQMSFGKQGEHRNHRSGGQWRRKNGEIFANAFQGKLAEFGTHQMFQRHGIHTEAPDTQLWQLGTWDDTDLEIHHKKINIKSAAHFSNLLLLECKDWDSSGNYIPNVQLATSKYDFFIFTRISPDAKNILKSEKLLYENEIDKHKLHTLFNEHDWFMDCPGFLQHEDLLHIINSKMILPQNGLLNGKMKMDANNYYCQAADLKEIETLIQLL